MSAYSNVPVKAETKKRLEAQGRKGETWDELITRLLDELEASRSGKPSGSGEAEASPVSVAGPPSQEADG